MHPSLTNAYVIHRSGELEQAKAMYEQILRDEPTSHEALHLLGTLAFQQGRHGDAVTLIDKAVEIEPRAEYLAALGEALMTVGRSGEGIAAYRRAVELRHEMPDVHYNLGSALLAYGDNAGAAASLMAAISLRPNFPKALNNLGTALRMLGKMDEAIVAYRQAISLQPNHPHACANLGQAYKMIGQLDEALAWIERSIQQAPQLAEAHSGKVYTLLYHPRCNAAQFLWENLFWNQCHGKPLRTVRRGHDNDLSPDRKIRIGYVSPDFRDHVAGKFLQPIFENHDRLSFEVYAYNNASREDALTGWFKDHCDGFRNIHGVDDERAEAMIRQDKIDILLDTTMHMGGNRLPLFARKAAPIQVTFCAYPGTTGLETMDYRLTDVHLDPPEAGDKFYVEQSVRLPHTFWCYYPIDDTPDVNGPPIVINGHVTFGCLNNFCKINDGVLALWAKVMKAVARSKILLMVPNGSPRRRVLEKMTADGINGDRIAFADFQPRRQYLEQYHRIDIALDTFPYNGHTTSLDAFYMGIPVVTLIGQTVVGRAGWSQLSNLNLRELAARDEASFVEIVKSLAADQERLQLLRQTLRDRMKQSSLMDAPMFARDIERALKTMWQHYAMLHR